MDNLFVIVWEGSRKEVPPNDHNNHEDQGLLVYRSKEAADAAALYRSDLYSEDSPAIAIPLSEFLEANPLPVGAK